MYLVATMHPCLLLLVNSNGIDFAEMNCADPAYYSVVASCRDVVGMSCR